MQIDDVHYSSNLSVSPITVSEGFEQYMARFKKSLESGLERMAQSVLNKAQMTVPYKTGELSDTGRVVGEGLERMVIFGDDDHQYAGYQERGMRIDGSRVVRNYTTPGTGSRYLYNAFEITLKEGLGRFMQ